MARCLVLGNSGKHVTLETLSLTKFLRHIFQGQGKETVKLIARAHRNPLMGKGQGARTKNRRQSRLKQLRVAVSTGASLLVGSSPQNSKTNFVDLRDDSSNFQKLTNISPKSVLDRNTRTASFFNMPSSFQKLTKISAKNMLEIREL
jgi:hypothetical protein